MIELVVERGRYAVARGGLPTGRTDDDLLRAEIRAAGEVSSILPEIEAPEGTEVERGWRWLRVRGPLPFTEVGILAAIASPLAAAKVPIFVVSTYETDHILIAEPHLPAALSALRGAGMSIEERDESPTNS